MKTHTLRKLLLAANESPIYGAFCQETISSAYKAGLIDRKQASKLIGEFGVTLILVEFN